MKKSLLLSLGVIVSTPTLLFGGVYPRADVKPLECVPKDDNALVEIRIDPLPEGLRPEDVDARVYFRRGADQAMQALERGQTPAQGFGNFFYVPMYPWGDEFDPEITIPEKGSWSHWGVLPVPQEENLTAETYVAIYDLQGTLLFKSPTSWAPVTDQDCDVELNDDQGDFADNLIIGETVADQEGKRVIWWECEGLDTRINTELERRDDRSCFPVIWWANPAVWVPAAAVGGIGVVEVIEDDPAPPPVSPSAP